MEGVEEGRTKNSVEDNDHQREGTLWTATAHCITAVIGSGILALAWSVAQLGWIVGPIALIAFSFITYYTSSLLADCYRGPDPITGSRNRTYMSAVRSYLGPRDVLMCNITQNVNLWGAMISYTITSAISMREIKQTNCFHKHGHNAGCNASGNSFMLMFAAIQLILSQFPSLEKITWLSVLASGMSFGYSIISLCLCIAKLISHGNLQGTLMGIFGRENSVSLAAKSWRVFQALGNIAFAFSFSEVFIEIQDTLKSSPPENVTMKKATLYGIGVTSIFYLSIGCTGYAAFGNDAPGNILTGFYEPFWLVNIANICIIVHLVGAYQVFAQPIFAIVEKMIVSKWPNSIFIHKVHNIRVPFTQTRSLRFTLSKLISRSILVIFTTLVSMLFPYFNAIMGLLGAAAFWPLTIYFPINMFMVQRKIKRGTKKWVVLQGLCLVGLAVSIVATIGSLAGIVNSLKSAKPFHIEY